MSDALRLSDNSYRMYNSTAFADNRDGLKSKQANDIVMPRNMTTDEFCSYLKETDPELYSAIEYIDQKCFPSNSKSQKTEKFDDLADTRVGACYSFNPKACKSVWQKLEPFWQKLETLLLNKTKRPPRTSCEDMQDWLDKYNQYSSGKTLAEHI